MLWARSTPLPPSFKYLNFFQHAIFNHAHQWSYPGISMASLFNNHPSKWLYMPTTQQHTITSILRTGFEIYLQTAWSSYYLQAPTLSSTVHDITLHEPIIINPSYSMDSAHHRPTVISRSSTIKSIYVPQSNIANFTNICHEHSAIKLFLGVYDTWSTSNNTDTLSIHRSQRIRRYQIASLVRPRLIPMIQHWSFKPLAEH